MGMESPTTWLMTEKGQTLPAAAYVIGSVVLSIGALSCGLRFVRLSP